MTTDVAQKLWDFCNTLRHDGINYGDYIEQLTYLLFLKLADEKGLPIPEGYDWTSLRERSGTDLLSHYKQLLDELGKQGGLLGAIFAGALSRFREPVNLKKLINLIRPNGRRSMSISRVWRMSRCSRNMRQSRRAQANTLRRVPSFGRLCNVCSPIFGKRRISRCTIRPAARVAS